MAQRQQAELTSVQQAPHTLRVGLLQTSPLFGAVDTNLAAIAELRSTLGALDVALTPELAVNGYGFSPHPDGEALAADDPRLLAMTEERVALGFAERNPGGRPWNSYLMTDPVTGTRHLQRKLHPVSYAPWNEHLLFEAGSEVATGQVAHARLSTVICNDMWHPVVPWLAARGGAEVLVVPVASMEGTDPAQIKRTWEVILEHTALLLQCYVIFVNRSGLDSGVRFWGGSRVIGPDGTVLASLGEEAGATLVDLELDVVRELRASVPALAESRVDFVSEALADRSQQAGEVGLNGGWHRV